MFTAELTFQPWVAEAGYRWVRYNSLQHRNTEVRELPDEEWVLTENHDESPRRYRAEKPLSNEPALFRAFAEVGDRAACLAFANRYGMLDAEPSYFQLAQPLPKGVQIPGRFQVVPCDPEWYWTTFPPLFRTLIRVWDGVRSGDEEAYADVLSWEEFGDSHTWMFRPNRNRDNARGLLGCPIYSDWHSPSQWSGMEPPAEVAEAFLRQEMTKGLDIFGGGYGAALARVPDSERNVVRIIPQSLFKALFLQFAQAIAGNREQRPCKACGKWFELAPRHKGRKEFCNAACKVREYRERMKRTEELRAKGWSAKQIADEIQTELATVREWTKHKTRKKGK